MITAEKLVFPTCRLNYIAEKSEPRNGGERKKKFTEHANSFAFQLNMFSFHDKFDVPLTSLCAPQGWKFFSALIVVFVFDTKRFALSSAAVKLKKLLKCRFASNFEQFLVISTPSTRFIISYDILLHRGDSTELFVWVSCLNPKFASSAEVPSRCAVKNLIRIRPTSAISVRKFHFTSSNAKRREGGENNFPRLIMSCGLGCLLLIPAIHFDSVCQHHHLRRWLSERSEKSSLQRWEVLEQIFTLNFVNIFH